MFYHKRCFFVIFNSSFFTVLTVGIFMFAYVPVLHHLCGVMFAYIMQQNVPAVEYVVF